MSSSWLEGRRAREARLRERHAPIAGLYRIAGRLLGGLGLDGALRAAALDVRLTELALPFPALPSAFDGFRLLFVSDLHLDNLPDLVPRVRRRVEEAGCPIRLVGGDIVGDHFDDWRTAVRLAGEALGPGERTIAVLGNHDIADVAAALEGELGWEVLIDARTRIERDGAAIAVTGTDDPWCLGGPAGAAALAGLDGFGIALCHSPDLATVAAREGHALYLCGHTHGGQVCLPGGIPVVSHSPVRDRARGLWWVDEMIGFTSTGVGVSSLPWRANCPPQVVRITLARAVGAPALRDGSSQADAS